MITKQLEFKGKTYTVRIIPDISVRGGLNGLGTTTFIVEIKKGFQGRFTENKVIKLIKQYNRGE